MKTLISLFAALLLSACVGTRPDPEPIIRTVEVVVPGPTQPCVPKEHDKQTPDYADNDSALLQAVDAAARYALLWAGREQRIAREKELEAVVDGCPQEE